MSTTDEVNMPTVDDQHAKLLTYEAILADLGLNLITATSGRDALERLLKPEIAVVLVDVSMNVRDSRDRRERGVEVDRYTSHI